MKNVELDAEIAKLKAEGAAIREQLNKGTLDHGNDHQVRARKLLGEDVSVVPASIERLSQVQRELTIRGTARNINTGKIQNEERIAGNKQYEAVKPEVDRLGRKFAEAFRDLHKAHLEFDEYVSRLEDAGGNVSALRIRPNGLSAPSDRSSSYYYGLIEFIDAGFVSKGDMPKAFR
jgi:hypothetical protein